MRKQIISLLSLLLLTFVSQAQSTPVVEVILNNNIAAQDDVITADVFIRTDIKMIGVDVIISVDDTCLKIEGQELGTYFPPEDGQSITLFEETTDSSARRAMNILNFDRLPTADGVYFSMPLRVICEEGQADITVESAHLVEFGIVEYKSVEDDVDLISNKIMVSPDNAGVASTNPEPTLESEQTTTSDETDLSPIPESDSGINMVILAIGLIVFAIACLIILFIVNRRSRNMASRKL